jgi:hypothetical protein
LRLTVVEVMQVIHRSLFVRRLRPSRSASSATDTIGIAHHAVVGLLADKGLVQALLELLRLLILLVKVLRPGLHHIGVLAQHVNLIRPKSVVLLELLAIPAHKHLGHARLNLLTFLLPLLLVKAGENSRIVFLACA